MQSAYRRLSGEVDLEEDRFEGVYLYKKEGAHAFVAAGWEWVGSHTGSVVVAAVVVIVEASHKHREEYKWDLSTRSELRWACFRALATFLAVAGTRHTQSPHEDNCYLEDCQHFHEGQNKQGQNHDPRARAKNAQRKPKEKKTLTFRLLLIALFLPLTTCEATRLCAVAEIPLPLFGVGLHDAVSSLLRRILSRVNGHGGLIAIRTCAVIAAFQLTRRPAKSLSDLLVCLTRRPCRSPLVIR